MAGKTTEWSAMLDRMRKAVDVPAESEPAGETVVASLREQLEADDLLMQRILGVLYLQKRNDGISSAVSIIEIEKRLGLAREAGTFVFAYMKTKRLLEADDKSRYSITVEGIDYLRATFGLQRNP